jgi:hypothetical protein
MLSRNFTLSILLAVILAGFVAPSVSGQNVFLTVPQPNGSVPNQIIDFYAGGSFEGYQLQVSPKGGTLSINDNLAMSLVPWGYISAKWTVGRIYIIFLVNVTETNFRIGFLYLTNSSAQAFLLRWFDYSSGQVSTLNLQGVQHVYNRTVTTSSVELPRLHIPTLPTAVSGMYALGSRLYLNGKGGLLLNDTRQLKIVPLLNQLFDGPTDYNELWSLLVDDAGGYYFAILYLQNSDSSHVIIEHQLRLNDYRRLNGQTVDAKWTKGPFDHQVIVRTPAASITVEIDGFPFQTNNNGVASTGVPNGVVTVQVPQEITNSSDARVIFSRWNKYGASNPLSILVNSSLDITAKYDEQVPLLVTSPYGNPQGSGWYLRGTNATFSVENEVNNGNGIRRVFQRWESGSNSTENQAWIILNSPVQVSASWKTQFQVTVNAVGLPANASAVALVGNNLVTINGSEVYTQWIDANTQLPIVVQTKQITGASNNYFLSELRADNQTLSGNLEVVKPVDVSLVYSATPKLAPKLSLNILPSVAVAGYPLSITGSVEGLTGGPATVDIGYSLTDGNWQELATVPATQNGVFAYTWQPSTAGNYSIRAYWPGDQTHSSASRVVTVRVVGSSVPTFGGSDVLTPLLQAGLAAIRQIPYLSSLITFAASMLTLGYVLTSFLIPGGSPMFGYFIGSILVGFIYVFPLSAAVVLIRASKTGRRPSLFWLTPLLTIWLSSLALVIVSPTLVAPQPLVVASQVLLVFSNVFVIPLLAAFRLARLVI